MYEKEDRDYKRFKNILLVTTIVSIAVWCTSLAIIIFTIM